MPKEIKAADNLLEDISLSEEKEVSMEDEEIERESKREDLEGKKQDRHQRKVFASAIFVFMCLYMAAALTITFLCGSSVMVLSDSVLIALLTTTLADVIGVFSFVAKYLFPERH